jgi:ketosteroid isomerase-like protein
MGHDPNIELLKSIYAAWARGEYRRDDIFDPAIEFVTDYPEKRSYHGPGGITEGWRSWLSAWNDFTTRADDIVAAGEGRYVVLVHLSGRGKESGVPIEADAANLVDVRDGKIVRFQLFMSRDAALEAAGLR